VTVLLSAVALGACRGENLFTLTGVVSGTEPLITLTSPAPGFSTFPGDSVLVLAEVTAQEGINTIAYTGEYADSVGGAAYAPETESGNGATFLRLNNYLNAVDGQVAGDVYVVVAVTDQAGQIVRDSVKVLITGN
jgi:hypothetical protein